MEDAVYDIRQAALQIKNIKDDSPNQRHDRIELFTEIATIAKRAASALSKGE
jgi:hypothetical protein